MGRRRGEQGQEEKRTDQTIDRAVGQMLAPQNFQRFRAAVTAMRNRAVFEVPEILESIGKCNLS